MSVKKLLGILVFTVVAAVQSQVAVSGTVRDSKSKNPVAGADVTLIKLNLKAVTGTDGTFSVSGTSLLRPDAYENGCTPLVDPHALLFPQKTDGNVQIRILDCSGRVRMALFSGVLRNGLWRVHPPRLSPGMYLCTFASTGEYYTVRFLVSSAVDGRTTGSVEQVMNTSDHRTTAKYKASPVPVDTLLVGKTGYRSARLPVATYQESALEVQLEDTTASNADDATIVPDPSWTCFMPDGIPPPALGKEVFTITLNYSVIHDVGETKFGYRRQFDISGGSAKGDKIDATVLSGGLGYELKLSTGSMEFEQIDILKAGNTHILMRNAGVAPAGAGVVRMVLDFEAPNSSSYTWLHDGPFVANRMVDSTAKKITMVVYDVSGVSLPGTKVQIKDPQGVDNQTWDCLKQSGSQGTTVFTENCLLGGSIGIGATKRGSRNIIPITGGTTTGKVTGKILSGGADFQLGGIDARYTLAPNDGEFIIVRNCGSGTLYPVFEARVGGPYNFLNENKYISSAPGPGNGGVSITFSERR
ncbi:MAG: DUF3237 family protein [Chitinispirillaceae bacterium]|nr:DUF3237 family protein [Chitinispirillaceae bacterium]